EVVIGAETTPAAWADALADALPSRWIAQRRFEPLRDRRGRSVNYGVYLVGGRAAGLFTRLQARGTDRTATCAPTMVRAPGRVSRATLGGRLRCARTRWRVCWPGRPRWSGRAPPVSPWAAAPRSGRRTRRTRRRR